MEKVFFENKQKKVRKNRIINEKKIIFEGVLKNWGF
jgi:hypothetical protein